MGFHARPPALRRRSPPLRSGLLLADCIRNAAMAACMRFGRKLWKSWSGYHRRSLVDTKMRGGKRLGERVTSRTFERQVNELHIRAVILNRLTERGYPQTMAVA
ncbi:IS5 family transposase ISCte6 [Comamonas sp. PE63]|uniref:IS5 family transposase ISCte6 n=1 Tax=Comamonas brasiliensis TaxID=1812482 RepID=A0ABS5LZF3_9BURK|nr:IS5 family transposase ISCte6 [Comamonas sp. PE63]